MELRPDDDIYRFQAVWRDIRGWEIPFIARYVVWAAWFGIFITLFLAIGIFTPINFLWNFGLTAVASTLITVLFVADRITAENTLDAVITSLAAETADVVNHHIRKAEAARDKPVTWSAADLHYLTHQPEPSSNPVNWFRKPHQQ